MTDKKALKIIKRYIELKTRVEERHFPFTPLEYDNYMLVYDELKKIKKEYKEAEKQLKKSFEVLEILKTMIQQNDVALTPKENWNISNEDVEKLKEWLEK